MAVAVDASLYVVLDDEYRVVDMAWAPDAGVGPRRGDNLLDFFPGSRPLFLPYLEEAQRERKVVSFAQYFEGHVAEVRIVPGVSTLTLIWERLCTLDVMTLDGLRSSLRNALETLHSREHALRRGVLRDSLRVIEGGR